MNNRCHRTLHLVSLAVQPRLLREMLQRALENTPGIMVADQQEELGKLQFLFQQVQVDWIVTAVKTAEELPAEAAILLERYPSLSLLAIASDGDQVEVKIRLADGQLCRYVLGDVDWAEVLTVLQYKRGAETLPDVLVGQHRGLIHDALPIRAW